jgi:hypothetical protein
MIALTQAGSSVGTVKRSMLRGRYEGRFKLDQWDRDAIVKERLERYAREARASRVQLERSGITIAIVGIIVLFAALMSLMSFL